MVVETKGMVYPMVPAEDVLPIYFLAMVTRCNIVQKFKIFN